MKRVESDPGSLVEPGQVRLPEGPVRRAHLLHRRRRLALGPRRLRRRLRRRVAALPAIDSAAQG